MEAPKLIRGSDTGGPSVFLNSILYNTSGIYNGLFNLTPDCDMYLIYCFVMLIAACSRSVNKHPDDYCDLLVKINELDDILMNCLKAKVFSIDNNLNDAFILGSVPTASVIKTYDIKYLSSAFFHGPLALYVDCGLKRMIATHQMTSMINRFINCCVKDSGLSVLGYGNRTVLNRLRYCPFGMIIFEAMSKILFLVLIIIYCTNNGSGGSSVTNSSYDGTTMEIAIIILLISYLIYEIGNIEEQRWAISPSIVFDFKLLEEKRRRNCLLFFVSNIWRFCDLCSYLLLIVWLISKIDSSAINATLGKNLLSLTCVPMAIGLLRYVCLIDDYIGTLILNIFFIAKNLFGFIILYTLTGLGFGVFYYSVYSDVIGFQTPLNSLQTMFNAVLLNYDPYIFDGTNDNYAIALIVSFIFLVWTIIVLFNSMIAHTVSNYSDTWERAYESLYLMKFRQIQQFNMSLEKSPLCMLPPPFNLFPTVLYPFHVYLAWRERLYLDNFFVTSLAGYFSDWVIVLLNVIPTAVYECSMDIYYSDRFIFGKLCMILSLPLSIGLAAFCIIAKQLYDSSPKLVLKSKVSDGRLKLSYGSSRDEFENGSLSNFEDERLHKNVELYNFKMNPTTEDEISLPFELSVSRDDYDDSRSGVSLMSKTNLTKKSYNESYKLLNKSSPSKRNSTYLGSNIRITPSSPFLQLANVSNVNVVQQSLHVSEKIYLNNQLNQEDSNLNQLSVWNSTIPENKDELENNKPELLMHKTGTISPYQPGFSSLRDVKNFSSVDNDAEYPLPSQIVNNKGNNEGVKPYEYPSIYFNVNKYPPLFSYKERKEIFQEVLPEAFTDSYTVALRESEMYILELHDRLRRMESSQEDKLNLILEKVLSS